MHFRSMAGLVSLCLLLGASAAPAAQASFAPAGREAGWVAHVLGYLDTFLKTVWESDAGQIDPWGGVSLNVGPPADDGPATTSTDEAGIIDPLGGPGR
jgi:hypothetical protein